MPKRVDAAAQRSAIANAAIKVITETGLEGARLRDVAREAALTTGAITHYFDSKDAVLVAALEEIVRRTLARMEVTPSMAGPVEVATFIRRVCAYLPIDEESRGEWRVWLAFWGRAMADERLLAVHRAHYARIVDRMIEPLLTLRSKARKHSRPQLEKHADAVIAALDGVGTRATLEAGLWPPRRQREILTSLLTPMLNDFTELETNQ